MTTNPAPASSPALDRARWRLLRQLERLLDQPMTALAFLWVALLIVDFTVGLTRSLQWLVWAIWAVFVLHFLIGIVLAPRKTRYLRRHWLTLVSLILPAFRMLAVFRAFQLLQAAHAARSLSLLRLLTSVNRGMGAVSRLLGRRGVGYVVALTVLVTLAGAAGMAQFESSAALQAAGTSGSSPSSAGLASYWDALWWTAMILTTLGSEYWPRTLEGRVLGWLLAVYGFAIFGYLTACIASLFLRQDATAVRGTATQPPPQSETAALRAEIAALRTEVAALTDLLAQSSPARLPERERPRRQAS